MNRELLEHPSYYANAQPERPARVMADSGEQLGYGALMQGAARAGRLLEGLGCKQGDTICLLSENNSHFLEICWAAKDTGLHYACVSTQLNTEDAAYIVQNSGARVFLASHTFAELARIGSRGGSVYAAAKGGVIAFTKSIARENGRKGITANVVNPGPVDTPLLQSAVAQGGEKLLAAMENSTLLGRLGTADEVAASESAGKRVLMYLHGGGFKMGSLKSHHDFMARLSQAADCRVLGAGGDVRNPLASPLHGELHGLPPLLLHVGSRETGLDDSVQFAAKAQAVGVTVRLVNWPGMIHFFQQFAGQLPEARSAIEDICNFLNQHWPKQVPQVAKAECGRI